MDDRFNYRLISDQEKIVNVSIKENEVSRRDNYFALTNDFDESTFLSITRANQDIRKIRDTKNLITIRFEKDYEYETYERVVFSILDLFGNVGGVFGIFTIFGSYFVGVFASRFFNYSIISNFYQIDTSYKFEKYHSNNRIFDHPSENYSLEDSKTINIPEGIREEIKIAEQTEIVQNQNLEISPRILNQYEKMESKKDLQNKAKQSMSDRRRYHYNCMDF